MFVSQSSYFTPNNDYTCTYPEIIFQLMTIDEATWPFPKSDVNPTNFALHFKTSGRFALHTLNRSVVNFGTYWRYSINEYLWFYRLNAQEQGCSLQINTVQRGHVCNLFHSAYHTIMQLSCLIVACDWRL
jgi:hypothetical protein